MKTYDTTFYLPVKMLNVVDFPAPLCPNNAMIWPSKARNVTLSTATKSSPFNINIVTNCKDTL